MSIFEDDLGLIIAIVLVIFFAGGFIIAVLKGNRIKKEGIATDAVISRVELDTDEEGSTSEICYVVYKDENGMERESKAALNSVKRHNKGEKVRIKFLPGDYKFVVETKE